jgi:hypothetical protein
VFYHLLPAPDNALARRLFGDELSGRKAEWTIAEDGSLYVLAAGATDVRRSKVEY